MIQSATTLVVLDIGLSYLCDNIYALCLLAVEVATASIHCT